jgi:hypothetical protein
MAFLYDLNGVIPTTGAAAIRRLKTLLVSHGWTVPMSGTGTSGTGSGVYSSSSDLLTTDALMTNVQAWFRIQDPAGLREFTFQRTTANYTWRFKYSATSKFTSGSPAAGVTPSATDEAVLLGSGTDASPTGATMLGTTDGNYRIWLCAGDSTIGYGFYFAATTQNLVTQQALLYLDVMKASSFPAADTDPAVVYTGTGSSCAILGAGNLGTYANAPQGWLGYGLTGAACQRIPIQDYYNTGASAAIAPGGLPQNPSSKNDTMIDAPYARDSGQTAPAGWKGCGSLFLIQGTPRTLGTPYKLVTNYDYAAFGSLVIPTNALMVL